LPGRAIGPAVARIRSSGIGDPNPVTTRSSRYVGLPQSPSSSASLAGVIPLCPLPALHECRRTAAPRTERRWTARRRPPRRISSVAQHRCGAARSRHALCGHNDASPSLSVYPRANHIRATWARSRRPKCHTTFPDCWIEPPGAATRARPRAWFPNGSFDPQPQMGARRSSVPPLMMEMHGPCSARRRCGQLIDDFIDGGSGTRGAGAQAGARATTT